MKKKQMTNMFILAVILILTEIAVLYVLNIKADSPTNEIAAEQEAENAINTFKSIKNLVYDADHKETCTLDISYIKDGKAKPLILCIHGGYYTAGDKSDMGGYLDYLPYSGYVVAAANYPLLPETTIVGQIESVMKAIDYLSSNSNIYEIDNKKIIILGFSSGANVAVTASEKIVENNSNSNNIVSVIDISGPTDYRYLIEQGGGKSTVSPLIIDGNADADLLEELKKIDSTDNITDKLPPVLIIHGEKDTIVPSEVSKRFYKSLSEAGVNAELKLISSMGHVTDLKTVITVINSFLEKTLK